MNCFGQMRCLNGLFYHFIINRRIKERDLVPHRTRDTAVGLLNIPENTAAFAVFDGRGTPSTDGHFSRLRLIEAEQQFENCTLARTGAASEGDDFAGADCNIQMGKNLDLAVITEVNIFELNADRSILRANRRCGCSIPRVCRRCHLFFRPLLKIHEFVDAVNAGDRGLDGLNFHADALDRAEYLRNIVDHCNRSSDRHPEERSDHGISGCREDIDSADNDRIS